MQYPVNQVFDVSLWERDQNHGIFPIGARDKEMLWSPSDASGSGIRANWPYLFKQSIQRYPDQYWTEVVAYIVGMYLQVDVPRAVPAIRKTEEGEIVCGSLIEWFYDERSENKETFIHASSFFKDLIPDFDEKTGKQHNLVTMYNILISFQNAVYELKNLLVQPQQWLCDMLLFDTLIGNTDRHQENWGIILQPDENVRLSPLFDNGTSLGHERFVDKIQNWTEQDLCKYVQKAKHHLRGQESNSKSRIPHFPIKNLLYRIESLYRYFTSLEKSLPPLLLQEVNCFSRVKQKIEMFDVLAVFNEIDALSALNMPVVFSKNRSNWIKKVINTRLDLIKKELEEDEFKNVSH